MNILEALLAAFSQVALLMSVSSTGDVGVFAQKFGNMAVAGLVPQRIFSCLKSLDKLMNFRGFPIISCVTLTDESKMNGLGNGMDIVKTGERPK